MDSDFNGGYGSALGAKVGSVGHNVWETKNIQTALLSEMLFSSGKNLVCRTSVCCMVA